MKRLDNIFTTRRCGFLKRSSEFVALIALFTTFFLLLHTRDLHSRLRQMENKLQPDELSAPSSVVATAGESAVSSYMGGLTTKRQQPSQRGRTNHPRGVLAEQLTEDDAFALNNTRKAKRHLLFFNRVPKVGSQTFMKLLMRLSLRNKFEFYGDKVQRVETIRLAPDEQAELATVIDSYPTPGVFVKHVCFVNFTEFDLEEPIYLNVVRDPVERVISWYYYVRAPWYYVERKQAFPDLPLPDVTWLKKDYETCIRNEDRECQYNEGATREGIGDHRRQSMFFCGHNDECVPFNSATAVERAKRVVDRHYAVVGVLEDMNTTLAVLERYIPRFFDGAVQVYREHSDEFRRINKNIYKPAVSEEIKEIVRKNFTREIEFYEFCRQKLYRQYAALRLTSSSSSSSSASASSATARWQSSPP